MQFEQGKVPDNSTPFVAGVSGNPSGRPVGPITKFLREYGDADELEFTIIKRKDGQESQATATISTGGKFTINQAIAARLLQMALSGDMKAIKEVLNRTEGRIPQPINLGDINGNPLGVMLMVPDSGRLGPPASNIPPASEPT